MAVDRRERRDGTVLGSTPIGGPIAGWVADTWGGRAGLVLGAVACLVAAGLGALVTARTSRRAEAAAQQQEQQQAAIPVALAAD